jgi:hypothetical protein
LQIGVDLTQGELTKAQAETEYIILTDQVLDIIEVLKKDYTKKLLIKRS